MSILILAEHNNKELKSSTLSAITAASEIDENIEVIVIGSGCDELNNKLKC
jgi:electron transfer flavoprotein alpha subunit